MINKAKTADYGCILTIKNHTISEKGCIFEENIYGYVLIQNYMEDLAKELPDMEFTINIYDNPFVLKHRCIKPINKLPPDGDSCFCDSFYKRTGHNYFITQFDRTALYEKVPLFSNNKIP